MSVEKLSPKLDRIVSSDQRTEELGRGYQLAEGPGWYKEGGYLLFSGIRNNRRMRWGPNEGISVLLEPSNNSNGLTRDPLGRLIFCEQGLRRVSRLEADGSITVVADRYQDKQFNRPNDVVVKSDGSIYFTDPITGGIEPELDYLGVYRVSPDLSTLTLLVDDISFPNGLEFSPDESILYVNNSRQYFIKAFDVNADGILANGRILCELKGELEGNPDGMKVDVAGNLYCTGPGGLWIMDPSGEHLGTILVSETHATNCAWGGDDWKTLFITTFVALLRIQMKVAGVPVPR